MPLPSVPFYRHALNEDDILAVTEVLLGLELTSGAVTREAEDKLAAYTGRSHAVAVSNGTTALFLALKALGIGPGDEVITTPMTFVSTSNAILHTGATPVFVDVEADTGLLDASLLDGALSSKTKAIIPVHLYGQMADMRAISAWSQRHNLFVVEDAAHALEAERENIRPGELSDLACYSFYATKNLTSGEGGAICTDNALLADKLRSLRLHGVHRPPPKDGEYAHWDMVSLGYKSLLPNILAALLVHQMDRLETLWRQRRDIAQQYKEAFADLTSLHLPTELDASRSAYHLFPLWVPANQRDDTLVKLKARGIGASVHYRAVHLNRYYQEHLGFRPGDFPVAEAIGEQTLSLPFYPGLQADEIKAVQYAVSDIVQGWSKR